MASTHSLLSKMLGHLVNPSASPSFSFCPLINESKCDALEALASGSSVPVVAYNALAWNRTHYFNLPVPTSSVQGNSTIQENVGNSEQCWMDTARQLILRCIPTKIEAATSTLFLQVRVSIFDELIPVRTTASNGICYFRH